MPWFGRQGGQKSENQRRQMGFLNAHALPEKMFLEIGQMYGWEVGLALVFSLRPTQVAFGQSSSTRLV